MKNTRAKELLKFKDALEIVLKHAHALPCEIVCLTDSLDRFLWEDVYADTYIPALDNSSMDGYAVRALDTRGASRKNPIIFEVIDDVRAGYISKKILKGGQSVRIMTGAVMPGKADCVVMVEDTRKQGADKVRIFKEAKSGEFIRRRGEDIKKGELVIPKGTRLNSAHIGMLASLGKAKVKVARKPKIAILATGDEVVDIGEKLEPGKLRSSNSYTLYSQVIKCGAVPVNLGIARDEAGELEKKIRQGFNCDLILTSGGVSVGEYDLVKSVFGKIGVDIKFWRVAMRPGKPLVFGLIRGKPVFGLPGNPVSSMISFEVFVKPAILKMLGESQGTGKEVGALLEEDIEKNKGLRLFLRAQTRYRNGVYFTRTTGPQGSGILKSMVLANSLMILPEKDQIIKKGKRVTVRFLE